MTVNGRPVLARQNIGIFTQPISFAGLPVASVPIWLAGERMPIGVQVLYVTPLLVAAQLVPFVIRLLMGAAFPGWRYLVDGFVEAALWPIASHLLLMPQRRPVDPDDTRPI